MEEGAGLAIFGEVAHRHSRWHVCCLREGGEQPILQIAVTCADAEEPGEGIDTFLLESAMLGVDLWAEVIAHPRANLVEQHGNARVMGTCAGAVHDRKETWRERISSQRIRGS